MPEEDWIIGEGLDEFVPSLDLVFEGPWYEPDDGLPPGLRGSSFWESIRPIEVAVVIQAVEEIYLASIRGDLPPADYREQPDWAARANPRSLTMVIQEIRLGSPLHLVLDLPATIYIPTFSAFAYGLAHVLGVPYRAGAMFHRARESYFTARVASAEAKDEWLDYKAAQVERESRLRLKAVDYASPPKRSDERPIEPPSD
jgi:hypothetical protein